MEIRSEDLERFFTPESVALVGVPRSEFRLGGMSFLYKLQEAGFPGRLYPINPKADAILGLKAYPGLSSLPEMPQLVMLSVAATQVPAILEECAALRLRHIHVLSSGFAEMGTEEGRHLERQVASIAKERGLLVMGPNCMGPYCPSSGLTAWGAIPGLDGPVGVISQSGLITQRLTEYTCSLGVGVGKAVSIGNGAVLDACHFLRHMAEDARIRVIGVYLETARNGREFFRLARQVTRKKPIVLWRGGQSEAGARTAASHTGSMAGEKRVWEGVCRQSGMVPVGSMGEWGDTLIAFSALPAPGGKGVFLVGGGGGNSVANSDLCIARGLEVPPLSESTMEKLRLTVPQAGSIAGNPLDDATTFGDVGYLTNVLELAYEDPAVAMVVVDRLLPRKAYHMPPDAPDTNPEAIAFLDRMRPRKPTVFVVDSDGGDPELAVRGASLRAHYTRAGVPAFPSTARAAKVLMHLYNHHARSGHGGQV